ncbi:MAG: DivIVA domain-containing protein [Eubacteriales bacterium]|jgi:cell division initiation protein
MLAPHELKNKTFKKTMRGYNPAEVDDYIEFLIDTYTNLYRENSELERKLKIVVTNLDEIKEEEEAIRSTLLKSQKLGEKIIRDANEKAEVIINSIKDRCDAIIADFRNQLAEEKKEMWKLRTKILDFKKNIYDLYRDHIEELQSISVNELEDIVLPNEAEIVNKIFVDVKSAIQKEIAENQKRQEDEDLNAIPITKPSKISQVSDEEYIEMLSKKQSETDTLPAEEIAAEEETEDQPVNSNTAKEEATSKE